MGNDRITLDEAEGLLELALSTPEEPEPDAFGERYELGELLGQGGMGDVRWAVDQRLLRSVALKTLRSRERDATTVARFLREAQITGQLEHPGIVPVHDVGVDPSGAPFFTMRRIEGQSLAERLEAGTLGSLLERLDVFKRICETMAFAHDRGVVHTDLKPGNVMVGPFGEVIVLDWGIAKRIGVPEGDAGTPRAFADHVDLTQADAILGTPAFMSPEQALGKRDELGPSSDVYSLGALLYVMLAGTAPFRQRTPEARMIAVSKGQFLPLREVDPDLPRELEAIVTAAMHLDPAQRYASALSLRDDVQAFLEGQPLSVVRYGWFRRLGKWLWRHRRVVGPVLGTVIAATVVGTVLALTGGSLALQRIGAARDLAVSAEEEARFRYADGLVSQAILHAEGGQAPQALTVLSEARRILEDGGGDTARADWVERYVHLRRPPPAVTWRHPDEMPAVPKLRADGKRLLSRDDAGVVRLHELPTGKLLASHSSEVGRVATQWEFHGDRPVMAQILSDEIRVSDVETSEVVATLPLHGSDPRLRILPQGFAVACADTGIRVYDAAGGLVGELPDMGKFRSISQDGRRAMGHAVKGTLAREADLHQVVDTRTGEILATSPTEGWLTPTGEHFLRFGRDDVSMVAVADGKVVWKKEISNGGSAIFGPEDRDHVVVSTLDGWAHWLRLWDGHTEHTRRVDGAVFSVARGHDLVAVREAAGWSVWWAEGPSPWLQVDQRGITAAATSTDDELVATSGWSGRVRVWHWSTHTLLFDGLHTSEGVRDVVWIDEGRRLASAGRDGSVAVWDPRTEEAVVRWSPEEDLGLAMGLVELDDGRLWVAYERGDVRIWDPATGAVEVPKPLAGLSSVWDVAPLGEGQIVASGRGDHDPGVVVWDVATQTSTARFPDAGASYQVDVQGERVAVATHRGRVWVGEAEGDGGDEIPTAEVTLAAAFDGEGEVLAAGTYAGEVQLWDPERPERPMLAARFHQQPVTRVAWAGTSLLTFDGEGRMHRFDRAPRRRGAATKGEARVGIAQDAAERQDWPRALNGWLRAREDGVEVPALWLARAYVGAGQHPEAETALGQAVAAGAIDASTATWVMVGLTRRDEP